MAKMQPYVYNRGQQIGQSFKEASGGLDKAFQNLIDKKKQEYDFVQKQVDDVELIKKDLNRYNYDILSKNSNSILQDTASAIKENGKLDFQKLGEIKRRVTDLSTAKRQTEVSIKALEDITKMVSSNAANMRDPIGTSKKIMDLLSDEKNIFSPKDIYASALDVYNDGIDYDKLLQNRLYEMAKTQPVTKISYYDVEGNQREKEGKLIPGYTINPQDGKVMPKVTTNPDGTVTNGLDITSKNILSPEELEGFRKQIVKSGSYFNPNLFEHVAANINNIAVGSFSDVIKVTKEDRAYKQSQADVNVQKAAALKYTNSKDYRDWERALEQAKVNNQRISASAAAAQASWAGKRYGLSVQQFDADMQDKGYVKQPDGSLLYDENNDQYKKRRATGDNSNFLDFFSETPTNTNTNQKPLGFGGVGQGESGSVIQNNAGNTNKQPSAPTPVATGSKFDFSALN